MTLVVSSRFRLHGTATVSALKKAIKEEKQNTFRNVEADVLQVSDLMPTVGC